MRDVAIIRLVEGRLAWYPPGASDGPQWLDQEAAEADLRAVISQRKLSPVFAAPGDEVRLVPRTIAAEERRHLARSLPYMLEEELAEDVAELHFASCAVSDLDYAVAVCSREKMAEYQAHLASFPGVNTWVPEPLLLPWQAGEWCLLLEGDRAVVRHGLCEGFAAERAMVPMLLQALLAGAETPQAVIIYGAEQVSDIDLLPEPLRTAAQWRQGDLYTAMLIADAPGPQLNLRQGEWAVRLPLERWWQQWRVAAMLFGAAVAAHLLAGVADYRQLQAENLSLRSAVEASYRQAVPRGAMVRPEKQLQDQLDSMVGSVGGSDFVGLLASAGQAVKAADGSIVSVNYNDRAGELRLNLLAGDYEAVERIRSGLGESGLSAVLENSSAQGDKVRARMRVGGKS